MIIYNANISTMSQRANSMVMFKLKMKKLPQFLPVRQVPFLQTT